MSDQPTVAEALWAKVPGQAEAVRQLRAAVSMPTHAYLISGPPGAGKRELATAFCASLLARGLDGDEADRVAARVESGDHGGVVVVEREGPFVTADDARRVVERASRSPLEGDLQIIVIIDFHLVRDAGPMLLKSIEEPPPRTMFVLLSEELPRELETIASRCVVINVDAVPVDTLLELLVSEGIDDDVARAAAEVAGGSLTRARLLARDPKVSHRRDLWYRVPERLNGRGSRAGEVADDLVGSIEDLKAPLAEMEAEEELTALDARLRVHGDRSDQGRSAGSRTVTNGPLVGSTQTRCESDSGSLSAGIGTRSCRERTPKTFSRRRTWFRDFVTIWSSTSVTNWPSSRC
ncbi:MAG: hypothetical protein R2735_06120 [Microthrixaceae bacterium]